MEATPQEHTTKRKKAGSLESRSSVEKAVFRCRNVVSSSSSQSCPPEKMPPKNTPRTTDAQARPSGKIVCLHSECGDNQVKELHRASLMPEARVDGETWNLEALLHLGKHKSRSSLVALVGILLEDRVVMLLSSDAA